jgi:hypothetical protein
MSEVGALIIRLQAETAQFRDDMGKVKSELADLGGKSQQAGDTMDQSFTEGRGGLMLTEDLVGVRLPRHLNNLIAQIPGVGAAFAAMLPIAGILVFIEAIAKLIEKHEALKKAIQEASDEAANHAVKEADQAKSLEVTNLKLDDQIRKLEHKPAHNYMKEPILETSEAIDKLAAASAVDFQKMSLELLNQTGLWHSFARGLDDAWSGHAQGHGYGTTTDALKKVREAMEAVEDARRKMAEAPLDKDSQAKGQKDLVDALQKQNIAIDYAVKNTPLQTALLLQLKTAAATTAMEIKNLHKEIEIGSKKKVVAGLEQNKENLLPLQQEADLQRLVSEGTLAHAQATNKLAKTQAEAALEAQKYNSASSIEDKVEQEKKAVEIERQAAVTAANDALAARKAAYDADIKAAGANAQKKKEIEQQYKNAVTASEDAIAQANAEAQKQITAIDAQAGQDRRARAIAAAQAEADGVLAIAIQSAKNREKQDMQSAKDMLALHQMNAKDIQALEIAAVKAEVAAEVAAYKQRIKNLDTFAKDYAKKVQDLNNKIQQAEKTGDDHVTQIKHDALMKQLADIQQAETRMYDSVASNVAKSIVENKNLVQSFAQTGQQLLEGMLKNLIMMELTHNKEKLINAKKAYGDNYTWASAWGGPVAGAIAGAAGFAAVMAFEKGGKIPGEGAVPIIGHGGETVVTKALTDRVERAEGTGGNTNVGPMHVNYAPHYHGQYNEAEHQRRFDRSMKDMARRRGMRLN